LNLFIVEYKYDVGDLVELTRFLDSQVVLIIKRKVEYVRTAYDVLKYVRASDIVVQSLVTELLSYEVYVNSGAKFTVREREIIKKVGENVV
jgi:hypothetical protein